MSFAYLLDILVLPCQTVLVNEANGRTLMWFRRRHKKCQKGVLGESGIQSASALPIGREIPVVAKDSVQDTLELATSGGSVLVADIQVSGQGVGVQDSVLTTQSKSSSQKCEDATGSVCVVPPLGCSKVILLTDCLLTFSDPDVPCLPVVKTDKTVEQGSEYHGFSVWSEKLMC